MTSVQTVNEAKLVPGPVVAMDPASLRGLLSMFVHVLMDAEVDARCGAGHEQRSKQRVNGRRGYRKRDLRTSVGRVELSIPRLRSGVYRPDWLMARPGQAERALTDAIAFGYRHGFSADQLRELMAELGVAGVDEAQAPTLAEKLEGRLAAVREQPPVPIPVQHTAPGAAALADEPRHLATAEFLGVTRTVAPEENPGTDVGSDESCSSVEVEPDPAATEPISLVSNRFPRRRPLAVAATAILTLLSGVALCSLLAPHGGSTPSDFQSMMPALVNVIEMPGQVTRADLLAATCGTLHDDFHHRSDAEILAMVRRMDRAFGSRTIDRVERVRRGVNHTAHAVVTATAERVPTPGHPGKPVDVEFDTSTTPWRICAVRPATP